MRARNVGRLGWSYLTLCYEFNLVLLNWCVRPVKFLTCLFIDKKLLCESCPDM